MHLLLMQVALTLHGDGTPMRFGAPVPPAALAAGLRLGGEGSLQWRPLPGLPARTDHCWIELLIVGARGPVRLQVGGQGAAPPAGGPACSLFVDRQGEAEVTEWRWADGSIDRRERTRFAAPVAVDGEVFAPGEWRTVETPELAHRADAVVSLPRAVFERVGLLPPDLGLAGAIRRDLAKAARALVELPGVRGRGDHARSGGIVTNLEFDTAWALLRLSLALGDVELLQRARRAAEHLVDRDLDGASGLPFPHGTGHRTGTPEPGHAWLQGLAACGAVFAEPTWLGAARQIAAAIAAAPVPGEGRDERARDFGWPLQELEAWLCWADDPAIARAADRLAQAIAARFDARLRTFRFGEGEGRDGYFERGWITFGIVVPALQAHLRRRPDARLQGLVDAAVTALRERIGQGRGGLPTHWRCWPGSTFAEHRAEHDPKAFLLLEALSPRDLQSLLGRPHVRRGLSGTPRLDDPDLPTSLTMAARCGWVYR